MMARARMITLFDLSAELRAAAGDRQQDRAAAGILHLARGRLTPVNPIGDLFKTQVWELAREVGVPEVIVAKPASADLIKGQTDEGDFGISYPRPTSSSIGSCWDTGRRKSRRRGLLRKR